MVWEDAKTRQVKMLGQGQIVLEVRDFGPPWKGLSELETGPVEVQRPRLRKASITGTRRLINENGSCCPGLLEDNRRCSTHPTDERCRHATDWNAVSVQRTARHGVRTDGDLPGLGHRQFVTANGMDTNLKKRLRAASSAAMKCSGSVVLCVAFQEAETDI